VLGDDRRRAVGGKAAQDRQQGLDPAGGGADGQDVIGRGAIGAGGGGGGGHVAAGANPRPGRRLHLADQFVEGLGAGHGRLGDRVHRPDLQRRQGHVRARCGQGRDHHHRHGAQPHDLIQELQPVHIGHFDVQREDVGIQLLDGRAGLQRIGGGADDFDFGVRLQGGRDQAAHGQAVVHDQNFDAIGHQAAPRR
jgi:hypothetical protein